MKEKILPSLVLTIIAVIVCGALVLANELTKDKVEAAQKEKISSALSETFGDAAYTELDKAIDGIDKTYSGDNGTTIFEITQDGYAKGGLHVLIGFDKEGKLCGVGFLDMGETPGLGTKVRDQKSFTEQFIGLTEKTEDFEPITGATFSSKGMKAAIDKALDAYNDQLGGAAK